MQRDRNGRAQSSFVEKMNGKDVSSNVRYGIAGTGAETEWIGVDTIPTETPRRGLERRRIDTA